MQKAPKTKASPQQTTTPQRPHKPARGAALGSADSNLVHASYLLAQSPHLEAQSRLQTALDAYMVAQRRRLGNMFNQPMQLQRKEIEEVETLPARVNHTGLPD